jgi:hypothetical protein
MGAEEDGEAVSAHGTVGARGEEKRCKEWCQRLLCPRTLDIARREKEQEEGVGESRLVSGAVEQSQRKERRVEQN